MRVERSILRVSESLASLFMRLRGMDTYRISFSVDCVGDGMFILRVSRRVMVSMRTEMPVSVGTNFLCLIQ